MWTPDAQAYERVWFTCQDKVGDLLVVIGLAFYPNLGTAEAFAIVNVRGRHTTVRAHQPLRTDRMDMTLGPFRFEVVEPFRRWRLRLDRDRVAAETGHEVGFDITWHDTKRPVFRQLGAGVIVGGRALSPIAGYDGFGRQEGTVEVGTDRFDLSTEAYLGTRDHHWGTRDGVGGPGRYMGMQHPHSGEWVEFAEFGIWGDHVLYNLGDARKRSGTLARRVHRMRFEPRHTPPAQWRGRSRLRRRVRQDDVLRTARGPDRLPPLWHVRRPQRRDTRRRPLARHGRRAGDEVVVHAETFDVTDPEVRRHLAGQDQHHCRVTCDGEVAYGLVEPYDTLCYEVAKAGVMGFSLLQPDA